MRLFTVDSFTSTPFKGNPAGVCVLDHPLKDEAYINIARELNYSETAFVLKVEDRYHLRWFTPTEEVDLCGHATLATAKILFDVFKVSPSKTIYFDTKSGELTVSVFGELLEMDFPAKEILSNEADEELKQFVKHNPVFLGKDSYWCLIELENAEDVINFKPNFKLLYQQPQKAFIITAKSLDLKYDFVSRVFAPAIGINEDPVTGSAHCYLAVYWADKLNKNVLRAFQASERSGEIICELLPNQRVLIKGEAVIMSEIDSYWEV